MFTVSIPLSGHVFVLVSGIRIFISWYFDGHQINFSKIMCWVMLTNGPILVVMTKEILCCIDFMEFSSLFWATKMWFLCNSDVMLQLNNVSDLLALKLKADRSHLQDYAHMPAPDYRHMDKFLELVMVLLFSKPEGHYLCYTRVSQEPNIDH